MIFLQKSECQDRDFAKLQQIYVGSRETVSTCNSQNSSKEPEVITKSAPAATQPQVGFPIAMDFLKETLLLTQKAEA